MPEPSFVSLLHFMDKHGGTTSIEFLVQILDSKGLSAAAKEFGVDKGWLCRFVRRNFLRVHILHPEMRQALDHFETIRRTQYENEKRREATILRIVPPARHPEQTGQ